MSPHPIKREFTYDFSPFLTCPAVKDSTPPRSQITAIPIPETLITSPLAKNIAPHILLDLREFLMGVSLTGSSLPSKAIANNGRWDGLGSEKGRAKGEEVWRSWKRAYDLWNGYYIEGRVNEGWVREEYEAVRKELEDERRKKAVGGYLPPRAGIIRESESEDWSTRAENGSGDGEGEGEGEGEVDDRYATFMHPVSNGMPPEPTLRTAGETAKQDGSTGGFIPMKLLPEYIAPEMDESGNYPEGWEDVLANTVWRPRRTGEREGEPEVRIDGEWGAKSECEFDGGVDCGRSPYPCLRYVVEYVRRDGCFLKKKVWDRVSGTIFNLPTKPAHPSESVDEQRPRMATLYREFYRNKAPRHRNPDYFPLDIRRVDRIDPTTGKRHPGTPLLEAGEELIRWPWTNPEGTLTELDKSDPWYVTEEQQELQLVPPRKYPPGKPPCAGGDTVLPTDDTIWKEEVENDDMFRSRYFVTNLHGGTLIINGQEVKRGQVAGPLPEFAIIETPGNQVSFWFGSGGRNWRGGLDDAPSYESQWATLRRSVGWENVGLTAGQVWDFRLRERLRRECTGADNDDDVQWAEWKSAVVKEIPQMEKKSPLEVVIWNGRPGTNPAYHKQTPEDAQPEFSTELEELEWLVTKADPLKDVTPILERENIIEPPESARWPGPYYSERPDVVHQRTAKQFWDKRKAAILQQQRDLNAQLAQERALRAREKKQKIDAENRKRKAASSCGPAAKKTRHETTAEAQAKAQVEHEKALVTHQEELDRQNEDLEIQKARDANLQADAAIAAKTREALAAQEKELSSLSERQREQEKEKIESQIRSEYEEQQQQEKMLTLIKIQELNKSRQEAEKQRKDAEKRQEGTATALEKIDEPAKDGLAALAKKVADAKAADAEKRRLQFIADKKLRDEQIRKAAAAAEARAEALKRARLFKDKFGVPPAEWLRLNASGNAEPGQGFKNPKKNPPKSPPKRPSFNIQLLNDPENMTDAQWVEALEYAKWLSLQPPIAPGNFHTGEEPVNLSRVNLQQQIDLAMKNSMRDFGNKNLEEEMVQKALRESMKSSALEQSARSRLEVKAKVEGISADKYAQNRGFASADAYIRAETRPVVPEDYPQIRGPADLPSNVLLASRYWIQREAREGLEIRAKLEERSTDDIVQEMGYENTEQYLQTLSNSITEDDIPPAIKGRPRDERELKWVALNQRITDAGEWDSRARALPKPGRAKSSVDWMNASYAEI